MNLKKIITKLAKHAPAAVAGTIVGKYMYESDPLNLGDQAGAAAVAGGTATFVVTDCAVNGAIDYGKSALDEGVKAKMAIAAKTKKKAAKEGEAANEDAE